MQIVFILYGSITNIKKEICSALIKAGKVVFIHVDMIDGLKTVDRKGIEFIKEHANPFGIITTKTE